MSIPPPRLTPGLRDLTAAVRNAAGEAWLVGGAVRDLLDRRQPIDLDFITTSDARVVASALAQALKASPFALDEERKTWRVVLPEGSSALEIDVSTIESGLGADLKRRDFTVDAMAAPINPDGSLANIDDPLGGVADLEARCLRMVSEVGLREDPLRLLRAVRLAIEIDLTIEDQTAAAIQHLAPTLNESAAERRREELMRIFATPRAAEGVRLLDGLGLLDVIFPELAPARGCEQPFEHHYWDVFEHSVETVASLDQMLAVPGDKAGHRAIRQSGKGRWLGHLFGRSNGSERAWLAGTFRRMLDWYALDEYLDARSGGTSRRALIKLAGLLHDVAKPETKTLEPDGRTRFFGHSEKGAVKASTICNRLRFGGRETSFVSKLVEEHLRPLQLSQSGPPSKRAIYRFFRDLGDAAPGVLFLSLADVAAASGPRLQPEGWRAYVAYIADALANGLSRHEAVTREPRLITGSDLIEALRLEPGPQIGGLLAVIDEAIAAGEVSSKEEALELAREMLAEEAEGVGR